MPSKLSWRRFLFSAVTLVAIALAGWIVVELNRPVVTARRMELKLRDGVLYRNGQSLPFTGVLVEEWKPGLRRTEVTITDGRAHGCSRGWYENGQLEVEEYFVHGVSHGTRTRWYDSGVKKSQVKIREGQLSGVFREWHPNGCLARETPLADGTPHGEVRSWDDKGKLVGTAQVDHGKLVTRN